jgi:dipeptidyl aminopeptidase/acylaminoacyl peptidase
MTLIALTKRPEVFAAGVALVPVTDWVELYELDDAAQRKGYGELFGGPPEKKGELYRDRSPINFVSNIRVPVLIKAGRNDPGCYIQPLERGYDRFGLGALEYANDCYKAMGKEKDKKVTDLKKRIVEVKKKLEAQAF